MPSLTRRHFLTTSATALAAASLAPHLLAAPPPLPRFPIGVCDWMILKRQKLGAFQRTADIGADGLEVDMGGLGDRPTFDNQLLDPATRDQFLAAADELGLRISSIAMSGFYAQSFAERDGIEQVVKDTVDTTLGMGVKTVFLPLGVRNDLTLHPELRPAVVKRLRAAGQRMADAGLLLGIETSLDAAGDLALLHDIGSPAVKIYFNFANALQNGRDLHAELRTLGAANICQIHATNKDVHWLENDPQIDVPAVKQTLDAMGWHGWLIIERSRDANDPRNVMRNFTANTRYLKSVFQNT